MTSVGADTASRSAGWRGREREAAAERQADERGAFDAECVKHADEIVDGRVLDAGRLGSAEEAEVVPDRPEARRERARLRCPEAGVAEATVDEQDRRAGPFI